jgi:hypothetical protein
LKAPAEAIADFLRSSRCGLACTCLPATCATGTIVTPGGPGPNLPKWPVMASSSTVTGRDPDRGVSAAQRYELIACRRPGSNPPKWPVMASSSHATPGRDLYRMSGHHPMRMSPGASAPRLRTCVMRPGLHRRACRRSGSGGPPPPVLLSRTLIAAATAISTATLQATKLLFLVAAEGSSRTPAGRRRALLGDLGWAPG